jgi:hypothetical protein
LLEKKSLVVFGLACWGYCSVAILYLLRIREVGRCIALGHDLVVWKASRKQVFFLVGLPAAGWLLLSSKVQEK